MIEDFLLNLTVKQVAHALDVVDKHDVAQLAEAAFLPEQLLLRQLRVLSRRFRQLHVALYDGRVEKLLLKLF